MASASVFRALVFLANLLFIKALSVDRAIQFEDPMKIYTVLQGDRVSLLCSPNDINIMNIFTKGSPLVTSGRLEETLSDEFEFECKETSCTLSIKQVEKKHADMYTCVFPQESLQIEVLSSPSYDYPVCYSSYTSTTFFLDSFQEPFYFSCLSEEANPLVNISLSVNHGNGEITDAHFTTIQTNGIVSLSYSSYLEPSFNNSTFVCTVTQQLPAPYHSYNKSCSFGPLMLPTFSVWIHPSHYTVTTKSTENITLMCTSNVSGVVLEWTNIPLDDWDYSRINGSLQLRILDYGASTDQPITIQCSGSYGGITVSRYATIDSASTDEHIILPTITIAALIVFFILFIAIVLLLIGVLKNRKKRRKKQQLPALSLTDTRQIHSPNDNNAKNVNVGHDEVNDDKHSSLNDAASNMIQDDTEMADNPINGSNRKQNSDFDRISDGSNSSIEMRRNAVYESYKPNTLRMEENKEEGHYCMPS